MLIILRSCQLLIKLEFLRQIFEKFQNVTLYENVFSWKAELFHADRRTDMTKLIVAFRNFAQASK